ncbi:MAG: hypothetical protein KKD38_08945, partial [Candidatus Delongbacteria bacterium]|nr:hypothetical protein [Candidatus Delongbacteria bacterium]
TNEITNNIIWGNNSDIQISRDNAYYVNFSFNAIQGGLEGFGNYTLSLNNEDDANSPYFADPDNNDWTLQAESPCIDTGVFWNALETDINLAPRPQGLCYDMGAYEYESSQPNAVPPTVSTLPAENISATYATLKGDITDDGGTQIIAKGIKHSEVSGFDPETEGILVRSLELLNEEEFEVLLSNLSPETTYYYRAYCESKYGNSYASEELSFTTTDSIIINPDANGIVYVKENGTGDGFSWISALNGNELQNGIDHASAKEVWVAKGKYIPMNWPCTSTVYKLDEDDYIYRFQEYGKSEGKHNGTTEREKHFALRPKKKLYGGFNGTETSIDQREIKANETILSGNIGVESYATDNSYHVIFHYYEPDVDSNSVIDGFTIQDGYADAAIHDDSYIGGGMYNRCSSPTIRNCVFRNNYAIRGGGISNLFSSYYGPSKPLIINTIITNNTAAIHGGGIWNNSTGPTLINCIISQNTAGNEGGGISHWIDENYKDTLRITHCTIVDNIAPKGSGLYIDSQWEEPDNKEMIQNSIIWGDIPVISFNHESQFGPIQTIEFCGITGGYSGNLNINLSASNEWDDNSPYFTDPVNNDYSLQYNSACKDMATYQFKTDEDILGNKRPQGAAYDMGAYEYITDEPNVVAPTVNTSFTENETASSVVCHTDVITNGGSPVVERGIKVSDIEGFDPETNGRLYSLKEEFFDNEYPTFVSDLDTGSKYYYRSYAENRMGNSYGQEEFFYTLPMTPDQDGIFYVKENSFGDGSSWVNALNGNDLQTAINLEQTNQVWIAKGTYKPNSCSLDREKHFSLKGGVEIYGGFAGTETDLSQRDFKLNETIFSGDIGIENDSTDNCYNIFINISEKIDLGDGEYAYTIDSTAVIDGFTITKGFGYNSNYQGGAGMYNEN